MTNRFLLWLALGLLLAVARSGLAAEPGLEQLRAGNYATVDQSLNGYEADYLAGRISDVELLDHFRPCYSSDPADERYFLAWVKAYPQSYAAHVAAASYFRHVAEALHGSGNTSQMPAARLKDMKAYLEQARQQAQEAVRLSPQPVLAYVQLVGIAQYTGTRQEARAYVDRAILAAPLNFVVRRKYMYALQTDWLGSVPLERAFANESAKAGLPARQVDVLYGMVDLDEGIVLNEQHNFVESWKFYKRGLAAFEQNAALFETGCLRCIYMGAAAFANDAGDFASGLANADKLLHLDKDSFYGHLYRAQALNGLGRLPEALPDLRITAFAGDRWSRDMLRHYEESHKETGKRAPARKPH